MSAMVFLPVTAPQVRALHDGAPLPAGAAYCATPTLRETFDYGPKADEDADFAAQLFASLRCLIEGLPRLVLAVSVPAVPGESGESDFGEVTRPPVRWRDVRAVFRDDPGSAATVGAYADTARGRTLADLWTDEATHDFLAEHDLLWFDPTELDQALDELPEPSTPPVNGD